ncbi:MAG: DUF2589 domain-containing protein [Candidatus Poribacteria bacterium]
MSDEDSDFSKEEEFHTGSAAFVNISLSQAILAPLDALFKAQIHAARSFLNLVMQLSFENKKNPEPQESNEGKNEPLPDDIYMVDFRYKTTIDGKESIKKISVPTLALVPIAPLAVESGEFAFDLNVSEIRHHRQLRKSAIPENASSKEKAGRYQRDWFLVDNPISIRGKLASAPVSEKEGETKSSQEAKIHIEIKVGKIPLPAGLDKLLTSLTQMGSISEEDGKK